MLNNHNKLTNERIDNGDKQNQKLSQVKIVYKIKALHFAMTLSLSLAKSQKKRHENLNIVTLAVETCENNS